MNRIFADRFCLFADHLKQFFVKSANQDFPSVRLFVSIETTRFLFTLQAQQFVYIALQNVLICTQFSCIKVAFICLFICHFIVLSKRHLLKKSAIFWFVQKTFLRYPSYIYNMYIIYNNMISVQINCN